MGEYGVHWNFFFTLAAIAILTSIINIPPKYCGLLGAVILVGIVSIHYCSIHASGKIILWLLITFGRFRLPELLDAGTEFVLDLR